MTLELRPQGVFKRLSDLAADKLGFLGGRYPRPPRFYYDQVVANHNHMEPLLRTIRSFKMDSQYLVNLLNYKPRFYGGQTDISAWYKLPASRRSAVLVLLFMGKSGELRVILTKRSRKLRHFSGHISFPGGKVDDELESPMQCARRETEEEIGISRHNETLRKLYDCEIREMKVLPSYMAGTLLAVAPCVGFLHWDDRKLNFVEEQSLDSLRLNPGESASVFSVPLRDFIQPRPTGLPLLECVKQSHTRVKWGNMPWDLRRFIFPTFSEQEVSWLSDVEDLSPPSSEDDNQESGKTRMATRNCWGLTANILHDLAEIVYMNEQTKVIGHEDMIWASYQNGQMKQKQRSAFEKGLIKNLPGYTFDEYLGHEEFAKLRQTYGER